MDTEAFDECLASGEGAVVVQGDLLAGESLGVNATPYFFINDMPIRGGLPVEALGRIIDYAAAGGPPPEIVPSGPDWHMRETRKQRRPSPWPLWTMPAPSRRNTPQRYCHSW